MKHNVVFFAFLFGLTLNAYSRTETSPSQGKIKCHISGTVIDRPQSALLMLKPCDSDSRIYPWMSVPIDDGKFDYTFYVDIEEAYELIFYEEFYKEGSWSPIVFFAEQGNINFTLYPKNRWEDNVILSDAPLNALNKRYKDLDKELYPSLSILYEERDLLDKESRYYSDEFKQWIADIQANSEEEKYDTLYKRRDELYRSGRAYSEEGKVVNEKIKQIMTEMETLKFDYIKNNPSLPAYYQLVSLVTSALSQMKHDPTFAPDPAPYFIVYEEIFKGKYPDHPYTSKMEIYISSSAIKTGGRYIDFTAPDANGKEFRLSEQIDGKVALIDLWASWCGPCRRSAKSMIPVYEKYKNKGFTVVGVARERDVDEMVRAVQQDGYPWLNLVELNDKGKIWQKYGADNSGGKTFLVDQIGTILAVDTTAEEVVALLEELLGGF